MKKVPVFILLFTIGAVALATAEEEVPSYRVASISSKIRGIKGHRLYPDKKLTGFTKDYITRVWDQTEQSVYGPAALQKYDTLSAATVGSHLLDLSIICWATESPQCLTVLAQWTSTAIADTRWKDGADFELARPLFALALIYDWHRGALGERLADRLKSFIHQHASYQFELTQTRQAPLWARSLFSHTAWANYASLAACGMALADDHPEGGYWAQVAYEKYITAISGLAPDGSSPHGLNDSVFGALWLTRALTLLEPMEPRLFKRATALKDYGGYFRAMDVTGRGEVFFDTGESTRQLKVNPAELFLKLHLAYGSAEYKDLYTFYLNEFPKPAPGLFWTVYGSVDTRGQTLLPAPTARAAFFKDSGLYVEKYSGSQGPSAFLFKSGVPGGRLAHGLAKERKDLWLDLSSNHPDQNHLMFWTPKGFVLADTGPRDTKFTSDHNTLLVNWKGQLGEGGSRFKESEVLAKVFPASAGLTAPNILSSDSLTIVSADAAAFYPATSGLLGYERTVVWLKDAGLLVADQLRVKWASTLQTIFHTDIDPAPAGLIQPLYPASVERTQSKFVRRLEEAPDQSVFFISPTGAAASLRSVETAHRVSVKTGGHEVYVRRSSEKPMAIGPFEMDAALVVVSGQDWTLYQAKSVRMGPKPVWASAAGRPANAHFVYDVSGPALAPEIKEL